MSIQKIKNFCRIRLGVGSAVLDGKSGCVAAPMWQMMGNSGKITHDGNFTALFPKKTRGMVIFMYSDIEGYLANTLAKQLADFGVNGMFIERITNSVREQILSCVYHWNDEGFRKALLIVGSEEGAFYQPRADNDIRNFVVVTIRNSEIESTQSSNFPVAGLDRSIADDGVKMITSAAIEYFSKVDLSGLQRRMAPLKEDMYYDLSKKHPISWQALTKLSAMNSKAARYKKVAVLSVSDISAMPVDNGVPAKAGGAVVSDALSFSLDPKLQSILKYCASGGHPFIIDSFKFLTRNIRKLLIIMEYLLGNGAPFVTCNYYIENGYIEKRPKILKAGHSYEDALRNMRQTAGLGARHKSSLVSVSMR
jgi:hypothetical protein